MSSKGYHWYNNGEIQINAKECPEGFIPGMLLVSSQKAKETCIKNEVYKDRVYTDERNKKISETKNKSFEEVKKRITYDILYKWYIEDNNNYKDGPTYFGITQWTFDRLCKEYGIKKDKSKARSKGIKTNIEKYGNSTNWGKGRKTREEHYGSVEESYKQGLITQKQTNLERYGTECYLNSEDIKSHFKRVNTGPNKAFKKLLKENGIEYYKKEKVIGVKAYDIELINQRILIEIDPTITHNINYSPYGDSAKIRDKSYHLTKTKLAKENGYRCIHVFDWDDPYKIINLLKPRQRVYARECDIKEVSKKNTMEYLNKYHLQGYAKDKVRLGLYYKDELVSIITFDKPRYNKNYEWELIRLCSSYLVVGGEEKLFKYFIKTYSPQSIVSYCDNAKFNGNVYNRLGFILKSEGVPTAHYYNLKTKEHITDNLLRQQGFDRLFGTNYGKGTDNKELIREYGFLEVYDCGQSKYIWKNNA